ncbi:MAG: hypothetical protein R3F14_26085 [Polyangiaceae bacterium]
MRAYTSPTGGRCCYLVPARRPPQVMHPRGRPLRVEGTAALPGTVAREDWQSAGPIPLAAPPLPPETRTALAAAWREEARMEHASIAAFAKLSLELLALGAPPDLLAGAHQAAIEEVAHAQMAFALASSYAAEPVGPSPLQQATSVGQEPITFARLVEETLMDGCAGETAAAVEAACAAETATDPSVIAALRTIADDESRHAELAFRILAWALRTSPEESAPAVERTLARLRTEAHAAPDTPARPTETGLLGDDRGPLAPLRTEAHAALDTPARPTETGLLGDDRGPLARHGVLGSGERARIRRQVLCEVVIPAIESAALRVSSSACTSPTCAAAS